MVSYRAKCVFIWGFSDVVIRRRSFFTGIQTTIYQMTWSMSPCNTKKQDPLGLLVLSLGEVEMLIPRLKFKKKKYISPGGMRELVAKINTLGGSNLLLLTHLFLLSEKEQAAGTTCTFSPQIAGPSTQKYMYTHTHTHTHTLS